MAIRAFFGARAAAVLVCTGVLAACTSTGDAPPVVTGTAGGCVDDSQRCMEMRSAALKTMLADPSRAWVRRSESPAGLATGVKLFAYRAKKSELSCSELDHGRSETQSMPGMISKASVPAANDSRIAQVKDLAGQVHKELSKEFARVCKSPTQAKKGFEARAPRA